MYPSNYPGPDSKNSYFAWRDVWKSIDLVRQGVKLTFQEAPLQFHYYAFKLHVAFAFVKTVGGVNTALKYIDYIFTNQEKFTEEAFIGSTLDQFLDNLATSVATATVVFSSFRVLTATIYGENSSTGQRLTTRLGTIGSIQLEPTVSREPPSSTPTPCE
ncbi:unnamed protein product [Sphagnum balticum]